MRKTGEFVKKLQESAGERIQKENTDTLEEVLIDNLREYGNQLMKEMIQEIGRRAEKGLRRYRCRGKIRRQRIENIHI